MVGKVMTVKNSLYAGGFNPCCNGIVGKVIRYTQIKVAEWF